MDYPFGMSLPYGGKIRDATAIDRTTFVQDCDLHPAIFYYKQYFNTHSTN